MNEDTSQLLDFMMNGHYLAAIGVALVLVVGLIRKFASIKVPWFATKFGGYVLGYGIATLSYVGVALEQGQAITLKLLLMALTAGITASGVLDHFRDAKESVKDAKVVDEINKSGGLIILIGFLGIGLVAMSCSGCPGGGGQVVTHDIVDCLKTDQGAIIAAVVTIKNDYPDWGKMELDAERLGATVGGCALAQIVQDFLSSKGAPLDVPATHSAHDSLEKFRTKMVNGATFHTKSGDL